ncbi:MAG: transcriptional repressor LexA [Desulfuromonadaceae bacterium]|nr:transcriptional repressor LexA [Desulfuromonadaceae bacterium]
MKQLSPRQQQVLNFITVHRDTHGRPPTLREIATHLGVSGTLGVMKHLAALERKGYLHRRSGSARGIILNTSESAGDALPIVGTVQAGNWQPATEEIEGYFAIDRARRSGGTFFLRVRGDSMIDAGIIDGDLALIRPQPIAHDRDIVVVLLDGEATLKRFFHEPGRIRLQPENLHYAPLYISARDGEARIVGKVVGLYRQLPD